MGHRLTEGYHRVKVLFIIPNLFRGGAEYQLVELCRSLRQESKLQLKVLTFYSEKAKDLDGHYAEMRDLGVSVDSLFDQFTTGFPLLKKLRSYLKSNPSDIIQAFLQANEYTSIASLGLTGEVYHGIRSDPVLSTSKVWMARLLDFRVRAYVGNAKQNIRHYQEQIKFRPSKAVTIYNGINLDRFQQLRPRDATRRDLGLSAHNRVFITVANMHFPFKGHGELLDAWCLHGPTHPQDHLVLVGTGSLREGLEQRARQAGLAERTHFLGMRTDVLDLLSASDVYISPSWVEGFSNSVAEAILCGMPVIATAVGGTPEMVDDGPHGALVPPNNALALATAMDRDFRPLDEGLIQAFRSLVDLKRLGTEYLALYRNTPR